MSRCLLVLALLTVASIANAWDLGALAPYSSRLNIDWQADKWSEQYDSEAKLTALGWKTVNITAVNCAKDTTVPKNEDQATVAAQIAAQCPGGDCGNKIFHFADNCQYDMLATVGNGWDADLAFYLPYSNFAVVNANIACNNEITSTTDIVGGCFGTSQYWRQGDRIASTYAWTSGSTRGTTVIGVDDAAGSPVTCAGVAANEIILLNGTNANGEKIRQVNDVSSVDGSCNVRLKYPLAGDFTSRTNVERRGSPDPNYWNTRRRMQIFLNNNIGMPLLPPQGGLCANLTTTGEYCGVNRFNGVSYLLFSNNRIGPYGQGGIDLARSDFVVIKHNTIGPNNTGMRFGARNWATNENFGGGARAIYDNIILKGTGRFVMFDDTGAFGEYIGFNYQQSQDAIAPETGNYCNNNVGNVTDSRFPYYPISSERSFLFLHETDGTSPTGFLIENNSITCDAVAESTYADDIGRDATFFRNRSLAPSTRLSISTDADTSVDSANWIANRWREWNLPGSNFKNVLGRWNVGVVTMNAPIGTSVDWGATNQQSAGANSNCPLALPASLAFRTDTPPTWWCQESGSWTAWSMGACEGASPPKLPAQIRSEGGACTPPNGGSGGSPGLSPPVLLNP